MRPPAFVNFILLSALTRSVVSYWRCNWCPPGDAGEYDEKRDENLAVNGIGSPTEQGNTLQERAEKMASSCENKDWGKCNEWMYYTEDSLRMIIIDNIFQLSDIYKSFFRDGATTSVSNVFANAYTAFKSLLAQIYGSANDIGYLNKLNVLLDSTNQLRTISDGVYNSYIAACQQDSTAADSLNGLMMTQVKQFNTDLVAALTNLTQTQTQIQAKVFAYIGSQFQSALANVQDQADSIHNDVSTAFSQINEEYQSHLRISPVARN